MPRANSRGASTVTEARRDVILWCLYVHGAGVPETIAALLKAHHESGMCPWPEADWGGARQDPYPVYMRQNLWAMARDGRVVQVKGAVRLTYAWNPEVLELRSQAEAVHLHVRADDRALHQTGSHVQQARLTYAALALLISEEEATDLYFHPFKRRVVDPATLLPDEDWARSLHPLLPFDFGITEDNLRVLDIHTERGVARYWLLADESWTEAVVTAGVVRG